MQHHDAIQKSRRHEETAAALQSRPSSLIDRLLRPMFSLGFSSSASNQDEEEEEEEEEVTENSERGACKYLKKIYGENPNLSCKKRGNGATKFCSRGHWKPSEDAKLRELVAAYGPQNWNLIAENLQGRSGKSCRLRWYNQLDPKINKRAFTAEEEERLTEAHRIYGNKWSFISRLFPGRTDNSVKNHWHVLMARRSREKSKSAYMKMKWSRSKSPSLETKQASMQETADCNSLTNLNYYGENLISSNYEHLNHGNSYTPLSASQVSLAAPTLSSASAGDQYGHAAYYVESTEAPAFIDFLGVGSR